MTKVLALDPGLKTGVALIDTDRFEDIHLEIVPDGLAGLMVWYDKSRWFAGMHLDVIVCESFELEEGTHGIDLTPVEIIGWLKAGGMSHNYFDPIVFQRRMQRGKDKLITDAVLKRAGLYPPRGQVKEKHQIEALRHALSYLVRQRHLETIRLLHPPEESE